MKDLINKIESLKNSEISNLINIKIKEFKNLNKKSDDELFKELCFCILTANTSAEMETDISPISPAAAPAQAGSENQRPILLAYSWRLGGWFRARHRFCGVHLTGTWRR